LPGPPPKPSAIRQAEGNPSKRPIPVGDLLPPREPEKPEWLSESAGEIWDGLIKHLMDIRVLQISDGTMLAELADSIAMLREARDVYNGLPKGQRLLVKEGAHGRTHASPLVKLINDQKVIVHRLATEFGMTPAARARLMLGDAPPAMPPGLGLDDFLDMEPPNFEEQRPN
jgi:P27 family predicted phage terminase small subunit